MRIALTFNVRLEDDPRDSSAGAGETASVESSPFEAAWSAEEEFDSPATIQAMAEVIESLGHEVDLLGEGEPMLRRLLKGPRPDLVLNIAEGGGTLRSREARVPALLEMLGIPHSGSDPLTLAVTLDKDCAKRLVRASGEATPAWALYAGDWSAVEDQIARLPFPVFVKPAYEGSSKGILACCLIETQDELRTALAHLHATCRQPVLVEEFIDGDELTVGLVGNHPPDVLGVMRILPKKASAEPFIYSLDVKHNYLELVSYECPAQLAPRDMTAAREAALVAWRALGCRDVARIDFRLRDGVPYFLEANPLPGLSPVTGDLVILARAMGVGYPELISRILDAALERCEQPIGVA